MTLPVLNREKARRNLAGKKMDDMEEHVRKNPLGSEKVSSLMLKFAIPSIIAMVIGALYNIVDQLFIGHAVGTLGNAATNVAFPLTTSCVALALLFGVGGAASFNLTMGRGKPDKAIYYIGNSLMLLFGSGVILCVVAEIFMAPLLHALQHGKTMAHIGQAGQHFAVAAMQYLYLHAALPCPCRHFQRSTQ